MEGFGRCAESQMVSSSALGRGAPSLQTLNSSLSLLNQLHLLPRSFIESSEASLPNITFRSKKDVGDMSIGCALS